MLNSLAPAEEDTQNSAPSQWRSACHSVRVWASPPFSLPLFPTFSLHKAALFLQPLAAYCPMPHPTERREGPTVILPRGGEGLWGLWAGGLLRVLSEADTLSEPCLMGKGLFSAVFWLRAGEAPSMKYRAIFFPSNVLSMCYFFPSNNSNSLNHMQICTDLIETDWNNQGRAQDYAHLIQGGLCRVNWAPDRGS